MARRGPVISFGEKVYEAAEQRVCELERIARAVSGEPDDTPNPIERLAKNYQTARAEAQRQWEARRRAEAKLATAVEVLRRVERVSSFESEDLTSRAVREAVNEIVSQALSEIEQGEAQ